MCGDSELLDTPESEPSVASWQVEKRLAGLAHPPLQLHLVAVTLSPPSIQNKGTVSSNQDMETAFSSHDKGN